MIRSLLLVSSLLAGVLGAEAVYRQGSGPSAPGGTEQRSPLPTAANAAALQARPSGAWLSIVLNRPLFAPTRRPAAGALLADPGVPRLSGIIVSLDGPVAIFQRAGDGKAVTARSGTTVDGWAVTRIAADAVDLRKASDTIVLRPRFEHLAGAALHEEAPPPPSRWEVAATKGLLRARWSNPQLQP